VKKFIPVQRGTREHKFLVGNLDLDASVVSTPWTFKFPAGPGTSGFVLTTDGAGTLSWSAIGAASDSTTPYYIPSGEVFTNNLNKQNLFSQAILVDGTLEINGQLLEV